MQLVPALSPNDGAVFCFFNKKICQNKRGKK